MSAPAPVREALGRLTAWLTEAALPLWATHGMGADGFHDRLTQGLAPTGAPGRVRVQARQAFVYALAAERGWMADAEAAARRAVTALVALKSADGLYRTPNAAVAAPLDGMGELYEQAFALLGLASGYRVLRDETLLSAGEALRDRVAAYVHPLGGFAESPGLAKPLFANPNMHLFEVFMAWSEVSPDPAWRALADGQATLALDKLTADGALVLEQYDADWRAPAAAKDRLIWPGHLFEWASLLLLHDAGAPRHRATALRLIEAAERSGVERGVALFALDGDLRLLDRGARLWAQTERLRAAAMAAALTGEAWLWEATLSACRTLEAFLDTPTPGLWRDWMDEAGVFRDEPAPSTSLYHIVGAIDAAVRAAA